MAVDIGGGADIRMTHPVLHVFQGEALIQQEAGAGMPQVVEPDAGQTAFPKKVREPGGHIVRQERVPIRPLENVAIGLVALSQQPPVLCLLGLGFQEYLPGLREEGEAAVTALVLGLVLLCHRLDAARPMPHGEALVVKVDAVPFQAQ